MKEKQNSMINFKVMERGQYKISCLFIVVLFYLLPSLSWAEFTNGGFENGLSSWTTEHLVNPATIPTFPPTRYSDLGLKADTTRWSSTVTGYGYVYTDTVTSGADTKISNLVRYPLYGASAARINYNGNKNRASSIDQTAIMALGDVDPTDNKVHILFSFAPVLENPAHSSNQQPYFYVEVTNITKGNKQLFYQFNYAGQAGMAWTTVGTYQYTNWQSIDIAPGPGILDVGDSVNVKIIASGCGPSGHEGHVYVDSGAGMTNLPGLNISAAGPANTSTPGTVTYTYNYKNAGTTPITGTKISIVSPQDNSLPIKNLTFNAISGISGCTTPAAGTAGTVSCNSIGVLNAGASGSFQATWNVPSPAIGSINHGTSSISGDSSAAILGPLVQTKITSLPLVDLAVSKTNNLTALTWGQHTSYTVTVSNNGPATIPSGWTVADSPPGTLTNVTWTCSGSLVACPVSTTGSGAINVTGASTFPSGGLLTYIVTADVVSGSGPGTVNNTVLIVP